jgi:hypothetical protein
MLQTLAPQQSMLELQDPPLGVQWPPLLLLPPPPGTLQRRPSHDGTGPCFSCAAEPLPTPCEHASGGGSHWGKVLSGGMTVSQIPDDGPGTPEVQLQDPR